MSENVVGVALHLVVAQSCKECIAFAKEILFSIQMQRIMF